MIRSRRWGCALLVITSLLVGCCGYRGESKEVAVRSALDVLADVVDPASKLARSTCDAKEELELARTRAGEVKAAETQAKFEVIRKRCDKVHENIELLRAMHEEAVERFEKGDLDAAMTRVEQARAMFRDLSLEVEDGK
jgi:hypothetical protein